VVTFEELFKEEPLSSDQELYKLLDSCQKGNRRSQDELYKLYYAYSMSICLRYSKTREEAIEIINDGFLKIFTKLDKYTKGLSFKGWLRRVMVNSAIDYFRKNEKHYQTVDISYAKEESNVATIVDQLSEQEILSAIQELPPSYRTVFNLFVIEGFKHHEIAVKLEISEGTSKSNLSFARAKLKKILTQREGNVRHG